jgi:hypothetical protein
MKTLLYTFFSIVLTAPSMVFAGGNNLNEAGSLLEEVGGRAGAGDVTIETAVGNGIGIVLSLVGLIFLVLMVYAGVLWLTARGEEGQVEKSRKIIVSSVIGLVLTISSYAITVFVTGRLGS